MKEQAYLFGKTKSLVGIVTEPKAGHQSDGLPAVLLINAGLVHRVGPHRIYVKIARRLAAAGFSVLRFDLSGIGDSPSRCDDLSFRDGVIHDVQEAMDFLTSTRGVQRFILMGICLGADNSLRVAQNDQRVVGAVLIEGYYFASLRYHLYVYRKRLLNPKSWLRLITLQSDVWSILRKQILRAKEVLLKAAAPAYSEPSGRYRLDSRASSKGQKLDEINQLLARGVHLYLIYCVDSPSYYNHYLPLKRELASLIRSVNLQVRLFSYSDHTFTLISDQEALTSAIQEWVMGVAREVSCKSPDVKKQAAR